MNNPKVSIIIPTYNRLHFLRQTLESVEIQTYKNWECIVVDDGSNDQTSVLLHEFNKRDHRFLYYNRPINRPKGANACRNYGLELSKGEFINWFDDDDLMTENFIDCKLKAVRKTNFDFVFSKTINFNENGYEYFMFDNDNKEKLVTEEHFVFGSVSWSTPDFFGKKSSLKGIVFNEILKSGQEYNFFVKVLAANKKGVYLDEVLTKRRIHNDSVQELQKKDKTKYRFNKYQVYLITFNEIYGSANKRVLDHLLDMAMSKAFDILVHKEVLSNFWLLLKSVLKQKGASKTIIFFISLICAFFFKKGYKIMNYCRR